MVKGDAITALNDALAALSEAVKQVQRAADVISTLPEDAPQYAPLQVWVAGTEGAGLRLRADHSLTAEILTVMPEGAQLAALMGWSEEAASLPPHNAVGDTATWMKVVYAGVRTGWCAAQYLSAVTPFQILKRGKHRKLLGPFVDRPLGDHPALFSDCHIELSKAQSAALCIAAVRNGGYAVYRRHDAELRGVPFSEDPALAARAAWNSISPDVAGIAASGIDMRRVFFPISNEYELNGVKPSLPEHWRWWNAFMLEHINQAEVRHVRASCGVFPLGTPARLEDWQYLRPALERIVAGGHALELHEYAAGLPWTWYGPNQDAAFVERRVQHWPDPGRYTEAWLMFRYRQVWERYFAPWGLGGIQIVIGETGFDAIEDGEAVWAYLQGVGWPPSWQNLVYAWSLLPEVWQGSGERTALALMDWYLQGMEYDRRVRGINVLGAAWFGDGFHGPEWYANGYAIDGTPLRPAFYQYLTEV